MNRRHFTSLFTASALAPRLTAHLSPDNPSVRTAPHMGCLWTLTLPDLPPPRVDEAAQAVFNEISRLNRIFSDYEPTSELNLLCTQSKPGQPYPINADLFDILQKSQQFAAATHGLFDITLAPCIRLWRRSRRRGELPDAAALSQARERSGWQKLTLDPDKRTATLAQAGMQLDLGGIAKGWTQDAGLKLLRDQFQITCVLLDAAGQVAAGSPPAGRETWHIGLLPSGKEAPVRISLKDANVATSGDHYQFVEINGIRYSHIIDPRTGLGSTISRQASLIAPTGALADPLTKLLCLMGPAESLPLLTKKWPGLQARITTQLPGQALHTTQTSAFPLLLS